MKDIEVKKIREDVIEIIPGKDFIEFVVDEFKNIIKSLKFEKDIKVIVNFKNIKFISSSGIASMGALYNMLRNYNGKLIFINLNSNVKSLFKLINLTDEITIYKDLNEAIKNV